MCFCVDVVELIVQDTTRYAERYIKIVILNPRPGARNCRPVTREKKYVTLRTSMLVGNIQKPRQNSHFSKSHFWKDLYDDTG
jgi:hypothetical protein